MYGVIYSIFFTYYDDNDIIPSIIESSDNDQMISDNYENYSLREYHCLLLKPHRLITKTTTTKMEKETTIMQKRQSYE